MALTSSITVPSMLGIVSRAPAVDEKVGCFFLSRFRLQVCDNGNAIKPCNFQNTYGTVA